MTPPHTEPSRYAQSRALKASQLAASLRDAGITAERAGRYGEPERRYAEKLAKVRKASDETWRIALDMLAGSAGLGGLCPYCWKGDPLGVPGPRKPFGHLDPCASDPPPRQ